MYEEALLQRLFSEFPDGVSGISLLLLRAVFGGAMLLQGGFYVSEPNASHAAWCLGLSAIVSGGLLLVGLFTPLVGALVGVGAAGVVLSLLPACSPNVFDSRTALVFGLTMLLTLIGTGPGRYSVDARMFGRREIIIPPCELPSERSEGFSQ